LRWQGCCAAVVAVLLSACAPIAQETAAPAPTAPDASISAAPTTLSAAVPPPPEAPPGEVPAPPSVEPPSAGTALALLAALEVKGRAPKTGYDREQFGQAWADVDRNGCDTRNDILKRDLVGETFRPGTRGCVVVTGQLAEPYTGRTVTFLKVNADAVHIDHVVSLSNAWQTGAQSWLADKRVAFANDPLNPLAVDGSANSSKGDGDAATWLPPNKAFRCELVARQTAVKAKYGLWVVPPERHAIARVLADCPQQPVPGDGPPSVAAAGREPPPAAAPTTVVRGPAAC
jgi:hypothetical protein